MEVAVKLTVRSLLVSHMTKLRVIIIGGGGHSHALMDAIDGLNSDILGYVDRVHDTTREALFRYKHLGDLDTIFSHRPEETVLINGFGSDRTLDLRRNTFQRFKDAGYRFLTVIHSHTFISPRAIILEGVQILPGAIVQPGVSIGENSILNTGSTIDHDCIIGSHVHIAPGVSMSGFVTIGQSTHIGTGASVANGVHIGSGCLVGAGAVVVCDVPDGGFVVGVPARLRERRRSG